jgi:hypothetical protein
MSKKQLVPPLSMGLPAAHVSPHHTKNPPHARGFYSDVGCLCLDGKHLFLGQTFPNLTKLTEPS